MGVLVLDARLPDIPGEARPEERPQRPQVRRLAVPEHGEQDGCARGHGARQGR